LALIAVTGANPAGGPTQQATKSEELLASQLEQLNERLSSRLSNRSNHVAQVDALQDEVSH
jgi:hypothetical protein